MSQGSKVILFIILAVNIINNQKILIFIFFLFEHSAVAVKPMITAPLTDITKREHETVTIDCLANATLLPGWTMFRWLKNDDNLTMNANKYQINEGQNPDSIGGNSMKTVLKIFDILKEDEAKYTCLVYYNGNTLKKFEIQDKFSDQATASLYVNTKGGYMNT